MSACVLVLMALSSQEGHAQSNCAFEYREEDKFVLAGGIRWEGEAPIGVYLDTSQMPDSVSELEMVAALEGAIARWNAVSCGAPDLVLMGEELDDVTRLPERSTLVSWSDLAPTNPDGLRVLGGTVWYCDAEQALCEGTPDERIHHTLVELYAPALPWGVTGCGDETDVAGVLQHELGHVLGLAHSDVTPSVMTARIPAGESWTFRAIRDDDADGLCFLYGCEGSECGLAPDATTNTLCVQCQTDEECGGEGGLCTTAGDLGLALCGTACFGGLDCEEGFECRPETRGNVCSHQCVPAENLCYDAELVQDLPCLADAECGGSADTCIDERCAVSCEADPLICPAGTSCSDVERADGTSVRVCQTSPHGRKKGCSGAGAGTGGGWLAFLVLVLRWIRWRPAGRLG